MKRFLSVASVFVIGVAVGWVCHTEPNPDHRTGLTRIDPTTPIHVIQPESYRPEPLPPQLVPHSYSVNGKVTQLSDRPDGKAVWLVTLDAGRIVIACTPVD